MFGKWSYNMFNYHSKCIYPHHIISFSVLSVIYTLCDIYIHTGIVMFPAWTVEQRRWVLSSFLRDPAWSMAPRWVLHFPGTSGSWSQSSSHIDIRWRENDIRRMSDFIFNKLRQERQQHRADIPRTAPWRCCVLLGYCSCPKYWQILLPSMHVCGKYHRISPNIYIVIMNCIYLLIFAVKVRAESAVGKTSANPASWWVSHRNQLILSHLCMGGAAEAHPPWLPPPA